ncbi:MAG TPA: DUF1737 domain-containing protein [Rickettsiales bacterium]|nr:DUF1737 domain-containing protein [Rickettsiales bacterium]
MAKDFFVNEGGILPNGKLCYRLLTGIDDKAFCERVSKALAQGYELYGSPSIVFNGKNNIVAQAVVWKGLQNSK